MTGTWCTVYLTPCMCFLHCLTFTVLISGKPQQINIYLGTIWHVLCCCTAYLTSPTHVFLVLLDLCCVATLFSRQSFTVFDHVCFLVCYFRGCPGHQRYCEGHSLFTFHEYSSQGFKGNYSYLYDPCPFYT